MTDDGNADDRCHSAGRVGARPSDPTPQGADARAGGVPAGANGAAGQVDLGGHGRRSRSRSSARRYTRWSAACRPPRARRGARLASAEPLMNGDGAHLRSRDRQAADHRADRARSSSTPRPSPCSSRASRVIDSAIAQSRAGAGEGSGERVPRHPTQSFAREESRAAADGGDAARAHLEDTQPMSRHLFVLCSPRWRWRPPRRVRRSPPRIASASVSASSRSASAHARGREQERERAAERRERERDRAEAVRDRERERELERRAREPARRARHDGDVRRAGHAVGVSCPGGDVVVTGTDRNEIVVRARTERGGDPVHEQRLERHARAGDRIAGAATHDFELSACRPASISWRRRGAAR